MIHFLLTTLLAVLLAGCAGGPLQTGAAASRHVEAMPQLQPCMTPAQVVEIMEQPDLTEMYKNKDGKSLLIYKYITTGKDITSRQWNDSNYTPFVFEDGKLAGWGWGYFHDAIKQEIIIKQR